MLKTSGLKGPKPIYVSENKSLVFLIVYISNLSGLSITHDPCIQINLARMLKNLNKTDVFHLQSYICGLKKILFVAINIC
jgi:hypothetical protein